jgi:hypothetical protein
MKLMTPILSFLFLAVTPFAFGNAKVLSDAVLESERVQVTIEGDTARVEGTFHFRRTIRRTRGASEREGVYFPLAAPKGETWDAEAFELSLELNGHKATSYSAVSNAPIAVPETRDYSLVWILASFPEQSQRTLQVVVRYEQKLLEEKFYYLPILETARPNAEGYEIRVKADRPIRSIGTGAGGVMAKGPRELVFLPAHLSVIAVAAGTQTTTPRSYPPFWAQGQPQRLQETAILGRLLGMTNDTAGTKVARFELHNIGSKPMGVSLPGFVDVGSRSGGYFGSTNATLQPGGSVETSVPVPIERNRWRAEFLCTPPMGHVARSVFSEYLPSP